MLKCVFCLGICAVSTLRRPLPSPLTSNRLNAHSCPAGDPKYSLIHKNTLTLFICFLEERADERKTPKIWGLTEMKRELNGIPGNLTVHWTLCVGVWTNKTCFCSVHQNFLHHGDTDAGLWKLRWKAPLSLWKTDVAVVETHFSLCSSLPISPVQHAFPGPLLHGSGWRHVSHHQHAGVQKNTTHVTADIAHLYRCHLGETGIVWPTVVAMVAWVVLHLAVSSCVSFLGHRVSLID